MRSILSRPRRVGAVAAALALTVALGACGGDDDDNASSASDTTEAAAGDAATDTTAAGEEASEYCALVLETQEQDFPTPEQLAQYQEIAPPEIADQVAIAAPVLLQAGDDMLALFAAIAEDDVEEAVEDIDAYESAECGVEHDPANDDELDSAAARVDVAAMEYEFTYAEPIAAGPTSFVLTNNGAQTHFLGIMKLADGVTLDEALQSDDDSVVEGSWSSGLAAPGGADEEVVNVELEPGTYAMVCWLPDVDGEPHAMKGMAQEFTVS